MPMNMKINARFSSSFPLRSLVVSNCDFSENRANRPSFISTGVDGLPWPTFGIRNYTAADLRELN